MKSDYTYQLRIVRGSGFIMIEDKDMGNASVTTNIENVIEEICTKENINPVEHHVIYKDSEGNWDGFIFSTNSFITLGSQKHWLKAATLMLEKSKT
jgi:hypothetical protein